MLVVEISTIIKFSLQNRRSSPDEEKASIIAVPCIRGMHLNRLGVRELVREILVGRQVSRWRL